MVRDDCAFLREAFDMFCFLLKIRERNEQWEVGVLVARDLEHAIKHALDIFPERITPRLNDHAAAHIAGLCEFGCAHHLLIPLGVILLASWRDGGGWCWRGLWLLSGHK